MRSTITHWTPILTFCPVNNLPDLIYIELETEQFVELYAARKQLRKLVSGHTIYMEDVASLVLKHFPQVEKVTVRLMFNKHKVELINHGEFS